MTGPGSSRELLSALDAVFAPLPPLAGAAERPIAADQTNRSVVVGEAVVVKHFTPPVPPPHRALRLARHLDAVGFGETPTTYGARFAGADLVAVVAGFLPEAVDGWEWCVDAALAGEPVGAAVGGLCARLHVALATPSAVVGDPVTRVSGGDWPERAESALVTALDEIGRAWTDGPAADPDGIDGPAAALADAAWLVEAAPALRESLASLSSRSGDPLKPSILGRVEDVRPRTDHRPMIDELAMGPRGTAGADAGAATAGMSTAELAASDGGFPALAIHGDLHVGQILRWRDGLAVIDFDGNPTVDGDGPQPLARDVAQMVMSFAHVGRIAIRRHGADPAAIAAWTRVESDRFLDAYRAGLGGLAHLYDERLVAGFAVEQECREIIYAARFRPTWRYAPMGALRDRFGDPPASQGR